MFRKELVEIINKEDVWVFIGSGTSIESGYPSWKELVTYTLLTLDAESKEAIEKDVRYQAAFGTKRFDVCLGRIEKLTSRAILESAIKEQFAKQNSPGKMIEEITSWPINGFITTNYDNLLMDALASHGETGWMVVGNKDDEIRKLSGSPEKVVWHIHGNPNLDSPLCQDSCRLNWF